jgi:prolyl-tRNA synthetase
LIGIPLRIIIGGKGLKEGQVEVRWRWEQAASKVSVDSAVATVQQMLADRKAHEASNVPA